MDKEDLKTLDRLFDKKLKPINKSLNKHSEKFEAIGEKIEVIGEKLDSHTVSLMNLEKEIKVYMDALDVERKRIDRHDGGLEMIEKSIDLNP